MKLDNVRRILLEDISKENQADIEKIAIVLNAFMENVNSILDNRVDFENLDMEIVTVRVTVDVNGTPTKPTTFSSNRVSRSIDTIVTKATNLTNRLVYPTGTPFVSFNIQGDTLYRILNISNLQANSVYDLRILLIGRSDS